ncbi:IPT/TIG domain-containing protein [Niveibacterium sp. 24ML]|uniref:IPT/TIG domain-containing protein n=1 Tax=Niveibacterium sp. 24ML TaxID=2985512 RepID=UPI00226E1B65|nr:IPT/TIG domain-containing protein [Niveibacterium sp. 24ML]MCX9157309.1 IPT/TIG domain-containing protein [Niveibacterium sp. 24ML]
MNRFLRSLLVLLSLSLLAACGGGGGGTSPPPATNPVTVSGLSPSFAFPGDTVTVLGTSFGSVTDVRLNGASIAFAPIDSTRLSFIVPAGAESGTVDVVAGTAVVSSPTLLTILGLPQVSAVSPASARPGDQLTLSGTNLANVTQVRVGGVLVTPNSRSGTQLVVTVPGGASSGALELVLSNGSTRAVSQTFVLMFILVSTTGMSPTSGPEGSVVRVTGAGLDTVSSVSVGGLAATIIAKTASTLDFSVPANSGAVLLSAPGGQSVNAGSFTLTAGSVPGVSIVRVDVAQAYSQPSGANGQLLVPDKAALLRAYVSASQRIASPRVSATISNCAASPSLTLSGPSVLPLNMPATDDLAGTFSAQIPASCVKSGLRVTVTVANSSPANSGATITETPGVGQPTNLTLVLVPLITNNSTGATPDIETVRRMFARAYPLDAADINITVRTPFRLNTTAVSGSVSGSWSAALSELDQLRKLEGNGRHYYGLVPSPGFNGGTSGLAYQNGPTNGGNSAWISAVGLDSVALGAPRFAANAWLDTMTHEVGHNMSLGHAPCGNPPDAETDFPYSSGGLGPYPVHEFDSDRNGSAGPEAVYFPSSANDVMGYCDGEWFSDYNYGRVQTFLQSFAYPQIKPFAQPVEMIDLFGAIKDGKVSLAPPGARMATLPYAGGGDHTLRVTTVSGAVVEVPFTPVKVADGEAGLAHFHVALPNPGEISRIEVLRGTQNFPVTLDAPPRAAALALGDTASADAGKVSWSEAGGRLKLAWDAARYPVLRVRHLGSQPTVLALRLTGGQAELPLDGIPAGGQWEFSLSAGFNARVTSVTR